MKIVTVYGYTKSGKTTTVECLIRELISRGYTVGSVKEIHFEDFTMDTEGSNTDRHRKAGAELVTARGLYETNILYKKKLPIQEILRFYKQDFVVLEGVTDFDAPRILCADNPEDIQKRMHPEVFLLSGVIANHMKSYDGLPVINALTDIERLADLVEKKAKEWKTNDGL